MSRLWSDRDFLVYLAGSLIAFLGMQVGRVVLPLLCYQLTGSAWQTTLLFSLQLAPSFALGLFAGVLADWVPRRRIMIIGYAGAGLALLLVPALRVADALTVGSVYAAAFLSAVAYVWAEAADLAALPALVGRQQIVAASSVVYGAWTITGVVGLPLGGLLAAAIGAVPAIMINAVAFGALAAFLPLVRRPLGPASRPPAPGRQAVRRIVGDISEGLRFIRTHPIQWPVTATGSLAAVVVGAGMSLVVVYGVRRLGLSDSGEVIGVLYGSGAIGAFAAAALLPFVAARVAPGRIAVATQTASAVLLVALALVPWTPVAVVLLGAWELVVTLAVLNTMSLRQRITPDRLQSRVNASVRLIAVTVPRADAEWTTLITMTIVSDSPRRRTLRSVVSAYCQVTGAKPGFGRSVSHSHRRSHRRFDVNLQRKTYWVPSLNRNVTLRVSARGIKTIDKRGIDAVAGELLARGEKI